MVYELNEMAAFAPPFIEETNVKRTKNFRKLQQTVLTYQKRGLLLNDNKSTLLMIDYINLSRELKSKLDKLAAVIEETIEND